MTELPAARRNLRAAKFILPDTVLRKVQGVPAFYFLFAIYLFQTYNYSEDFLYIILMERLFAV